MTVKAAFKGSLDIRFVQEHSFEILEPIDPAEHSPRIVRNALRLLMMGWSPEWKHLLTSPLAYAIFIERDPSLLKEWRLAFQQGFLEVYEQLKDKLLTPEQHEQVQLYLSNCLTLLPYSDITPYESFKIPQLLNGTYELVEYNVHPIELTHNKGWRRFFLRDKDRVFAYGLEPLVHQKAESHLIFLGTTYPAGQGFLTQLETDIKGFETVGFALYSSGRETLQKWLSLQKNAIHVCGVSLGGSLGLLTAIDKGDYQISRVDALNPAGLHDHWSVNIHDHWDKLEKKPYVVVQKQGNDFVSAFGIWKPDWDIIEVTPPEKGRGSNFFHDHFLNYAGFAGTQFTYVDPVLDNVKRKTRNFFLYSLARSVVYYGAFLPYTYILRPIVGALAKNWLAALMITMAAVLACLLLVTLIPVLSIGVLGVFVAFGLNDLYQNGLQVKTEADHLAHAKANLAQIHDPSMPRNSSMDIYNVNNKIEINLTHKDLGTYYQVIRGLVKEKPMLPDTDVESKYLKGVTKRDLLIACSNPLKADEVLSLSVKKAKAVHIRHVLTLVEKLGVDNQALKNELAKEYAEYCIGK